MLKREIKLTADGSPTLYIPEWDESYHSKHGAITEAMHVFIKNGWNHFADRQAIDVLEYGFGTGLNALITFVLACDKKIKTTYHTIEKFPLFKEEIIKLPISSRIIHLFDPIENLDIDATFKTLHSANWNETIAISNFFRLKKIQEDFKELNLKKEGYDLIYFDAFGMRVQPELWTEAIFRNAYNSLKKDGLLTTYACNGNTKRALKETGFEVIKLAGPPGKREMINAWKR